jgi:hypothetical protein
VALEMAIEGFRRSRHQLHLSLRIGELSFATSWWYDVDLHDLERRYGPAAMEWVYFHIAAFEANKLASLAPEQFDLGPFARLATPAFEAVWRTVFTKVWGQWRYLHDRPDYQGPAIATAPASRGGEPSTIESGPIEILAFCGGGKDSLAALGLLDRAGLRYASYAYASSIYGRTEHQHRLIDRLLDTRRPARRHRAWSFDDFSDSPITTLHPELGVHALTAAETPASIFAALPVVMANGYRSIALGHEASANRGNLVWDRTGEEVNHQWGKSLEAERLLNDYIQSELFSNVSYVSLLQPIHDPLIFHALNQDLSAVPFAHSCNLEKPWCRRCAKCAYVWLGYVAYLPQGVAESIFSENLFDVEENQIWFRQLLGLEPHTPFECVGQVDEARLAFELAIKKGARGRAIDLYRGACAPFVLGPEQEHYLEVDEQRHGMPPAIAKPVLDLMRALGVEARDRIQRALAKRD